MMILSKIKIAVSVSFVLFSTVLFANEESRRVIGDFSRQSGSIHKSWTELTFGSIEQHTNYSLVKDNDINVIKAESTMSASGLTKNIRFNPKDYPYLSWRWKINKAITGTDVTKKSGDDYAARIYVVFHFELEDLPKKDRSRVELYKFFHGKLPPLASLNYIWGNKTSIGRIVASPYTDRVRMVVLRNKDSALGQWHSEERNIYADYLQAFAEKPKDVISLAIMTDTDNTGAMAETFYGDIVVAKKPQLNNLRIGQATQSE